MDIQEPDQIDMMSESELRDEIRSIVIKNIALNKVYEAADKMIDAMPNIQNIPVSYANPVRKVYAAIAEVQLLTDSGIRTPCTGLHDLRSKGDGTAYCRDCGETCDISETGAAETAYE